MTADTTWTDRSSASDDEFRQMRYRFEAAPAAEESFDATAALRRVLMIVADWSEWAGTDNDPRSCTVRKFIDDLSAAVAGEP